MRKKNEKKNGNNIFFVMLALLSSACSELESSIEPSEESSEPIDYSTVITSARFEVSAELDAFTQTIDDTYFSKYGRHLFSDERWWIDYGTGKDSDTGKELHQYLYLEDKRP